MEINISKSNVQSLKTVISSQNDVNYVWDVIVPDSKPDIGSILKSDAMVNITGKEIMQDRAMLSGTVKLNILYIPAENSKQVKNIETVQGFNHVMELAGLRQNMALNVWAGVENLDISVTNSRKVHAGCNLNFFGNVLSENNINFVSEVESSDVEYLTREISTYKIVKETENSLVIQEEIEVPMGKPSINEILKLSLKLNNKDVRPLPNRMVMKGELSIATIYNGEIEGDLLQYMEHEIPLTEIFEAEGMKEESVCDTDYYIRDVNYFLKENSEGEKRIILVEARVVIYNKVFETARVTAVVDAYSKTHEIAMEQSQYSFDEIVNESENQFVVKQTADFGNIPDITKVIHVESDSKVESVQIGNNQVRIEGKIKTDILYLSEYGETGAHAATCEIPFSNVVEISGAREGISCELKAEILQLAYNIVGPAQLEIRTTMETKLRLKNTVSNTVVSNLSVDEDSQISTQRPSIVIYFCNEEEKIWDIAKKYRTTVNDILSANELEPQPNVSKGTKLLIP